MIVFNPGGEHQGSRITGNIGGGLEYLHPTVCFTCLVFDEEMGSWGKSGDRLRRTDLKNLSEVRANPKAEVAPSDCL